MSQMFLQFPFALLVVAFALMMLQAHAQDQSGFISIDCGQQIKEYREPTTGITYITDTNLIDTGMAKVVSISDGRPQFRFLRIFREGIRNCYKINNINKGQKYLIRATFVPGDYDREEVLPEFELHLGASLWDSVLITNASAEAIKELIHIPMRNYIHVCLINIGKGFPFISTIELRPLHKKTYPTQNDESLALYARRNPSANTTTYRYPEDVNDRIWYPQNMGEFWNKELSTSSNIDQTQYQLPSRVMSTALTTSTNAMGYTFSTGLLANTTYHIYLHFAAIESKNASLSRELGIYLNGKQNFRSFTLQYLKPRTYNGTIAVEGGRPSFTIYSPPTSGYVPFLNAYEIYVEKKFLIAETDEQDVEAITNLKSTYGIIKNWQGDPCYPQEYRWEGVNCSYSDHDSTRIIDLNLSSSGLEGVIADSIANLTVLRTLDLSNNELLEQIPESLSQLQNLQNLNLEKNELTGTIPAWLIAKKNDGLSLSLCGNPSLSGQLSCEEKKKKKKNLQFVIPVVVFIVVVSWVAFAAAILRKSKTFQDSGQFPAGDGALVSTDRVAGRRRAKPNGRNAAVWDYWRVEKGAESEIVQNTRGHDVFLSFRGRDTRTGFARNLYEALEKEGIRTFFDDKKLNKGDEIAPTLLHAIEASEICIILFSENYVTSSWCLGELAHIVDCKRKNKDRRVIPVFYKVNPTDIRHQSGSFSLAKWIDKMDANVSVWKKALGEVANLSGYTYKDGYEFETIGKIVKDISDVMEQKKKNSLHRFDTICPPDGKDEIVIYMTSLARDSNFQNCRSMIQSLSFVKVQLRDVTIRKFRRELKKLMGKKLPSPRLFVHGKYVGGYDEVSRLIKEEPWFCEALNKIQRRDEMSSHSRNLQKEEAGSVRDSGTDSGGHGGSPV